MYYVIYDKYCFLGFGHAEGWQNRLCPVLKGEDAQQVLDPRFSHFVAPPPPLPIINDRSLSSRCRGKNALSSGTTGEHDLAVKVLPALHYFPEILERRNWLRHKHIFHVSAHTHIYTGSLC